MAIGLALMSAMSLASAVSFGGVFGVFAAGVGIWIWRAVDAQLVAVQLANLAGQEITRGKLDEAEELIAHIPRHGYIGTIPRAVGLLRALIAIHRGNAADAVAAATIATDPKLGLLQHAFKQMQRAQGHSYRALAEVGLGETARAEQDAAAAEAFAEAPPDAIARARLVKALVMSRAGKHDDVAVYLRDNGNLFSEHLAPHERSLVRAVARMTQRRKRSVYREPARPVNEAEPTRVAGWIALVAPEAASFADEERPLAERLEALAAPPQEPAAMQAIAAGRGRAAATTPGKKKPIAWMLLLWVVLIVMFLTIWQFLTPTETSSGPVEPPPPETFFESAMISGMPFLFLALMAGLFAIPFARVAAAQRRQMSAARAAALGDVATARVAYEELTKNKQATIAAASWLALGKLSAKEAAFPTAVEAYERGIARIDAQPMARAAASDLLVPALLGELAVAKAAAGRIAEADGELAMLMRQCPQFPGLASTHARVRLVRALRMGDLASAAAVARERTAELPMPRREELLGDLALAATGVVSEDERERLESELGDEVVARWIEAVAPRLRDTALGPARRARVAAAADEVTDAHDAAHADEVAPDAELARAAVMPRRST